MCIRDRSRLQAQRLQGRRSAPCCSPLLFRKQVGQAVHARVSFSILPLPFGRTAPSDDGAAVFLQSAVSGGVGFARIAAGTASAAAAGAAGTAAGAVAAAGAFPRFSVTDHAADQQGYDQHDDGDENYIDSIGKKPGYHRITSFVERAARRGTEGQSPRRAALGGRSEGNHFTVSFCISL